MRGNRLLLVVADSNKKYKDCNVFLLYLGCSFSRSHFQIHYVENEKGENARDKITLTNCTLRKSTANALMVW